MKRSASLLIICLLSSASCDLLEMSQTLWTKLLSGAFSEVGRLDPLRVPVIKVDQSEGDTSYRMILRNVEIRGLNGSTLESIRVARGRLVSNLSELEAGYVSYSDLRDLDSIRYRFHTLLREPAVRNESFEAVVAAVSRDGSPDERQESRLDRIERYDSRFSRIRDDRPSETGRSDGPSRKSANARNDETSQVAREDQISTTSRPYLYQNYRDGSSQSRRSQTQTKGGSESSMYDPQVHVVYAHSAANYESTAEKSNQDDVVDCSGDCRSRFESSYGENRRNDQKGRERGEYSSEKRFGERVEGYQGSQGSRDAQGSRGSEDAEGSASENIETEVRNERLRYEGGASQASAQDTRFRNLQPPRSRLENRPGYIDIVYSEDKANGSVKHFGNLKLNSDGDRRVYGLADVMKDIRENRRFIVHNFTEGESLSKRNDAVRTALEARRLKDLVRYAKDYQEKEGYFEEGMELIYHYGGTDQRDAKPSRGRRQKRAHELTNDDDVMHVTVRIRVPLLQVRSQYALTGKVGGEILRGNGVLAGNFTELIGDFTVELKKVNENMMIVRAARAKLSVKDKKIRLQGMDEKGPVQSVLTHGLMAAEAVAAMLADDLATKALSEKTADAMVYRMYQNLPVK